MAGTGFQVKDRWGSGTSVTDKYGEGFKPADPDEFLAENQKPEDELLDGIDQGNNIKNKDFDSSLEIDYQQAVLNLENIKNEDLKKVAQKIIDDQRKIIGMELRIVKLRSKFRSDDGFSLKDYRERVESLEGLEKLTLSEFFNYFDNLSDEELKSFTWNELEYVYNNIYQDFARKVGVRSNGLRKLGAKIRKRGIYLKKGISLESGKGGEVKTEEENSPKKVRPEKQKLAKSQLEIRNEIDKKYGQKLLIKIRMMDTDDLKKLIDYLDVKEDVIRIFENMMELKRLIKKAQEAKKKQELEEWYEASKEDWKNAKHELAEKINDFVSESHLEKMASLEQIKYLKEIAQLFLNERGRINRRPKKEAV